LISLTPGFNPGVNDKKLNIYKRFNGLSQQAVNLRKLFITLSLSNVKRFNKISCILPISI